MNVMWSSIIGHTRQVKQLKRIAGHGGLANAYLFHGLDGIGKKLAALTFAQSLFCEKTPDMCGSCVPCQKIQNRQHPDFFLLEPEKDNILIDQVRKLQQALQFHPLEAALKVAIVDEAHTMTDSAANSLLKILEEPPSRTHFILISAFPHLLLPTIRSRCQQMSFAPLTQKEVHEYLVSHVQIDEKNAKRIAAVSQGSPGAIVSMDKEFVEDVLDRFAGLMKKANSADIVAVAESWSKEDERLHLIFDLLAVLYRDIIYRRLTGQEYPGALWTASSFDVYKGRSVRRLEDDFMAVVKARNAAMNTTANTQLLFEQLLFTLIS